MTKVVIVGASISGLATALSLLSSSSDVEVTLYDVKSEVGKGIVCAGGISSFMVKRLSLFIPKRFVACKVAKIRFYSPNMDFAEIEMKREYGLVLWRGRYEGWLGSQVGKLGGTFNLEEKVTPYNFPLDADVVVGADGIAGVTRRILGLKMPPKEDVHIATQAVGRLNHPEDTISMYLSNETAPRGFAWVFPQGRKEFRIGLGVPLSHGAKLKYFFKLFTGRLDAEIIENPKAKLIPTSKPMGTLVFHRKGVPILLVGDSGFQTDPATGGGIASAIIGGKCASEAIVKGKPELYDRLWKRELYRRNMLRYGVKQVLNELTDDEYCGLVGSLKDFEVFVGGSLGLTLAHALVHLALKQPKIVLRHRLMRRLLSQITVAKDLESIY